MDNYVAIVVEDEQKAFSVLHALWRVDAGENVVVKGAAVVRRDKLGRIDVLSKDTDPGVRALVGTAAGFMIGVLAAVAASAVAPAAVGAAVGAAAGLAAEAGKSGEQHTAASEAQFILPVEKYAVLAEVTEDSTTAVDSIAAQAGGKIYRRTRSTVLSDHWFGDDSNLYLYPYDYEPGVPPPK